MEKVYRPKACARCGQEFQPANGRALYCSEACKAETATCETCGKGFQVKSSTSGRYCSSACWYAAPGKSSKAPRVCPFCKGEFQPRAEDQLCCSKDCSYANRRSATRAGRICEGCGADIPITAHPRVRFCSRACAGLHRPSYTTTAKTDGSVSWNSCGYLRVKVGGTWVAQHRHVMEQILGRSLEAHERVHHKNGNRADNRPENLELWKVTKKDPAGVRAADYHCAGCACFAHKKI